MTFFLILEASVIQIKSEAYSMKEAYSVNVRDGIFQVTALQHGQVGI
jgi:hypothetical protein